MLSIPKLSAAAVRDNSIPPCWTCTIPTQHESWDTEQACGWTSPSKHYFQLLSSLKAKNLCVYSTDLISWGLPLLSGNSFLIVIIFPIFCEAFKYQNIVGKNDFDVSGAWSRQDSKPPKPTAFILLEISLEKRRGGTTPPSSTAKGACVVAYSGRKTYVIWLDYRELSSVHPSYRPHPHPPNYLLCRHGCQQERAQMLAWWLGSQVLFLQQGLHFGKCQNSPKHYKTVRSELLIETSYCSIWLQCQDKRSLFCA